MNFLDGSLFPENQDKLVITAAPYGPEWIPSDFPEAIPDLIIQVGGSISFAPENEGAAAKWLSDDTRHMLAELEPQPDQVTVTVNTSQMNVAEQFDFRDIAGTSMADPDNFAAYSNMI